MRRDRGPRPRCRAARQRRPRAGGERRAATRPASARAQAEMQAQTAGARTPGSQRLDAMLQPAGQPLQALDAEVEQQLLLLALAVGKQLARRELKADPGQIVAIDPRSRWQAAGGGARGARTPASGRRRGDVRERLAAPAEERAWTRGRGSDPDARRLPGALARTHRSMRALKAASTPSSPARWATSARPSARAAGSAPTARLTAQRAGERHRNRRRARGRVAQRLAAPAYASSACRRPPVQGSLTRMVGLTLEAVGCQASIGDQL